MTDLRKAANMALHSLEFNYPLIEDYGNKEQLNIHHEAIMALYKALAQPEQEPKLSDAGADTNIPLWGLEPKGEGMVALHQPEQEPVTIHCPSCLHSFSIVPVAKREWVGLTDDEIKNIMQRWRNGYIDIKDVEKLLKDKNT